MHGGAPVIRWLAASAPPRARVKRTKTSECIYYLPGSVHYGQVKMNNNKKRWFCSEAEAQAAGW
jgi:hypothetical protein